MPTAPFLAPERDAAFKQGRPKRAAETYYSIPGQSLISLGVVAVNSGGFDQYARFYVGTPLVIDQLAAEVTTLQAAANFRIGFYAANTDWQPVGAPLADSGNLDGSTTGVKTYTPGTPIYVPRGRYLSVVNCDTAGVAFRSHRCGNFGALDSAMGAAGFVDYGGVARAYAAFPTPGTAWDTESLTANPERHFVVYRVLTP